MHIQMMAIRSLIDVMHVWQIIITVGEKLRRNGEKIGKKRICKQTQREIDQWEDNMASNKIKITRCESGDWEILEYDGYRDSNHHIDYVDFLRHLGYEVEEVEVTDEEMEDMC